MGCVAHQQRQTIPRTYHAHASSSAAPAPSTTPKPASASSTTAAASARSSPTRTPAAPTGSGDAVDDERIWFVKIKKKDGSYATFGILASSKQDAIDRMLLRVSRRSDIIRVWAAKRSRRLPG